MLRIILKAADFRCACHALESLICKEPAVRQMAFLCNVGGFDGYEQIKKMLKRQLHIQIKVPL